MGTAEDLQRRAGGNVGKKLQFLPLFGDLMRMVQVHKIMFILKMQFGVRFDSTQDLLAVHKKQLESL